MILPKMTIDAIFKLPLAYWQTARYTYLNQDFPTNSQRDLLHPLSSSSLPISYPKTPTSTTVLSLPTNTNTFPTPLPNPPSRLPSSHPHPQATLHTNTPHHRISRMCISTPPLVLSPTPGFLDVDIAFFCQNQVVEVPQAYFWIS